MLNSIAPAPHPGDVNSGSPTETLTECRYYNMHARKLNLATEDLALSEDSETYLSLLVDIADALGVDDLSFSRYASAISQLSAEELAAKRSSMHLRHAEEQLAVHLASMRHEQSLVQHWKRSLTAELEPEESVPALERRRAALLAKIKEYQAEQEQLSGQIPEDPPLTITELATLHKRIKAKDKILTEKRAKVAAFQGLPPNIDLARHELRKARDEQMKLIQLRERLLDRMASGLS